MLEAVGKKSFVPLAYSLQSIAEWHSLKKLAAAFRRLFHAHWGRMVGMTDGPHNHFGFHAWTAFYILAAVSCFLAAQRALDRTIFSLGELEALLFALILWFVLWRLGRFRLPDDAP
jgi:hypothetical protein